MAPPMRSVFQDIDAVPLSLRDPDDVPLMSRNGSQERHSSSQDRTSKPQPFDLEFEEGDLLLDLDSTYHRRQGCCKGLLDKCGRIFLPRQLQQSPFLSHFSGWQRGAIATGLCGGLLGLFLLLVLLLSGKSGSNGSSSVAGGYGRTPHYMAASDSKYCDWRDLYLPRVVLPQRYTLVIKTDMQPPYRVDGTVQIQIVAKEVTPCVVLHAKGMNITSVGLQVASPGAPGGSEVIPGSVYNSSSPYQQVTLLFPEALPVGPQTSPLLLLLNFTYYLQEGLDGFYLSKYIDAANQTRVLASTQFEALGARKAFPCFDEPELKASFVFKLAVPKSPYKVLSNMPLSHTHAQPSSSSGSSSHGRRLQHDDEGSNHDHDDNEEEDDHDQEAEDGDDHDEDSHSSSAGVPEALLKAEGGGSSSSSQASELITYHFDETPPMSTYLLAWVVGDLVHIKNKCNTTNGRGSIPVAVWGTSDRLSQLKTAAGAACGALQAMEELLQVPYALPKMDLVAIPNFAAGAMENWGLLTYRESRLLVDDGVDDVQQRYVIATIVAHEVSHQWFGDLVTCQDWTQLWLNEGFARYFENVVADTLHPSYHYFNHFWATDTSRALEKDALPGSRPLTLQRKVELLAETEGWFDEITYEKGAAVLRMLRAWLNQGGSRVGGGEPQQRERAGNGSASYVQRMKLRRLLGSYSLSESGDGFTIPGSSSSSGRFSGPSGSNSGGWSANEQLQQVGAGVARSLRPVPLSQQPDPFLSALSSYLKANRYGSSTTEALLDQLGRTMGQPLQQYMSTWVYRRGFPIVIVSLGGQLTPRDPPPPASANLTDAAGNLVVVVEQTPYHAPRDFVVGLPFESDEYCNEMTENPQDSSWWIPLSYQVQGNPAPQWLAFNTCEAHLPTHLPSNGWVLANAGRYGFYRVNYSEPLWQSLTAAATDADQISDVDLAGLLDDSYSLSMVRQLNITIFLELTSALATRAAAEYSPWAVALKWLQRMQGLLATAALYNQGDWVGCAQQLKGYVSGTILGPFLSKVQLPGHPQPGLGFTVVPQDTTDLRLLRPAALIAAGPLGLTSVVDQAVDLVKAGQTLHPDVAEAVYGLAVSSGRKEVYDIVRQLYEKAADASLKARLLHALSLASGASLINSTLWYSLDPAVRSQDVALLLTGVGKLGGLPFNMTWQFVLDQSEAIRARFPGDDTSYSLGRRLLDLSKLFTSEDLLERLRRFDAAHPGLLPPTFDREASEALRINSNWLRRQGRDACEWLQRRTGSGDGEGSSSGAGG